MTAASANAEGTIKRYEFRLVSSHEGPDNEMVSIAGQMRREGEDFAEFSLSENHSSFLNFLYCAFTCQLAYLRMNAAERSLEIASVNGRMHVVADAFVLNSVVAEFDVELRAGEATQEDVDYLRERCMACPVSRNLTHVAEKQTRVRVAALTAP